jgi:Trk K+ transport system NAD-binding subunit
MAFSALQPSMVDFIDTATGRDPESDAILAELSIGPDSRFISATLEQMFDGAKSAHVLGIHQENGNLILAPTMDTVLRQGDRVIVMGRETELEGLEGTSIKRQRPSPQLP